MPARNLQCTFLRYLHQIASGRCRKGRHGQSARAGSDNIGGHASMQCCSFRSGGLAPLSCPHCLPSLVLCCCSFLAGSLLIIPHPSFLVLCPSPPFSFLGQSTHRADSGGLSGQPRAPVASCSFPPGLAVIFPSARYPEPKNRPHLNPYLCFLGGPLAGLFVLVLDQVIRMPAS